MEMGQHSAIRKQDAAQKGLLPDVKKEDPYIKGAPPGDF
jgi:hypothetical protein